MFPLFPFVAGVAAGVVALRVAKNEKTRKNLALAQEKLKEAGASSAAAVRKLTDKARARFSDDTEVSDKPAAKKARGRKVAAKKPAAKKQTAGAKKPAAKRASKAKTNEVTE